jgi:hypothetical protein
MSHACACFFFCRGVCSCMSAAATLCVVRCFCWFGLGAPWCVVCSCVWPVWCLLFVPSALAAVCARHTRHACKLCSIAISRGYRLCVGYRLRSLPTIIHVYIYHILPHARSRLTTTTHDDACGAGGAAPQAPSQVSSQALASSLQACPTAEQPSLPRPRPCEHVIVASATRYGRGSSVLSPQAQAPAPPCTVLCNLQHHSQHSFTAHSASLARLSWYIGDAASIC